MKYLLVIALMFFNNLLFGQELKENDKASENALIYFIRGNANDAYPSPFSAIVDGEIVCKLNIQTFSSHEISPGTHEFEAQFDNKSEKNKAAIISLDVDAGRTYYFKVVTQVTFLVKDVVVKELTRKSALRLMQEDEIQTVSTCLE